MNVLFLHQNFPAQFTHVARALSAMPDVKVAAITDASNPNPDLVDTVRYTISRRAVGAPNPLAGSFSARVARGEQAARAMLAIDSQGFRPDLVIGHLGWGETLFVRDVWPKVRLLVHAEYFYQSEGGDVRFDREFEGPPDPQRTFSIRAKNAAILMAMADADFGVAPTQWQGSRFPTFLQSKIAIIHEGVDTDVAAPAVEPRFSIPGTSDTLSQTDEVITFVNRNLEPYRGYHIFMRALPRILSKRPNARVVIVGGDGVSYGAAAPDKRSWKETFLDEVRDRLPMDRVHFVGKIPYPHLLNLLRISKAHIYLTYPFVLSWSMLEAMSVGAIVIGSKTPPVEEVIQHGKNGLLVNFFDKDVLADTVVSVLADQARHAPLRRAARATIVNQYDLKRICLPQWLSLIKVVAQKPERL